MARECFTDWLLTQTDRQDPVGELAFHYEVDAQDAPRAITADEVRQRLVELDAEPAFFAALDHAAEEYSRQAA